MTTGTATSTIKKLQQAALLLCLFCIALACVSCGEDEDNKAKGKKAAIKKSFAKGGSEVQLEISSGEISIGESVTLTLRAICAEEKKAELPSPDKSIGKFSITSRDSQQPKLDADNRTVYTVSFKLEPFLPGEYEIPPLATKFTDNKKAQTEIRTEAQTVTVLSVLPKGEEAKLKGIAPPVDLPKSYAWAYVLCGCLVALILAIELYVLLRKKNPQAEAIQPPPQPPHLVAYRELDELLRSGLVDKGELKEFYLRLSMILRRYIEKRFSINAPELTTEEFLFKLQGGSELKVEHKSLLKEFLTHCDMVKFAKMLPSQKEIDDSVAAERRFIKETEPQITEGKA